MECFQNSGPHISTYLLFCFVNSGSITLAAKRRDPVIGNATQDSKGYMRFGKDGTETAKQEMPYYFANSAGAFLLQLDQQRQHCPARSVMAALVQRTQHPSHVVITEILS